VAFADGNAFMTDENRLCSLDLDQEKGGRRASVQEHFQASMELAEMVPIGLQ
jgi:hypothetical protein